MPTQHGSAASTDWAEKVAPDEAERHAQFSATITDIQARVSSRHGPGRAFHRTQVAGLRGTLRVLPGLPPEAAQGLFAQPGPHPTLIRLSNGSITPMADPKPDIRGFALSVRGIDGPAALGGITDRQDFLLINHPTFGFRDTRDFATVVPLAARGQAALVKGLVAERGLAGGIVESARLVKNLSTWFPGFATATFHSAAPVMWGPYAAKVRLVPEQSGVALKAALDWRADVRRRLAASDLRWALEVQFFVDEARTPIEDGRVRWPERVAPFHRVATLTVPQGNLDSPEALALAEQIEAGRFDPWAGLADHRPLGEIMRARKVAYLASQRQRAAGDVPDPGLA
ncbi:MAG: Catalase [Actinomycetota bacterium]|nr:Catalase [Actinomycetota bacterium]